MYGLPAARLYKRMSKDRSYNLIQRPASGLKEAVAVFSSSLAARATTALRLRSGDPSSDRQNGSNHENQ